MLAPEAARDVGVVARQLPTGALHLHHGPIDILVTADASSTARERIFRSARDSLRNVLADLVNELPQLRLPAVAGPLVTGKVARRMVTATSGYGTRFITPMAAVAGAIADHVLAAALDPTARRIIVNNGGDIALHLAEGEGARVGIVDDPQHPQLAAAAMIGSHDRVGGIATSGWRGRSLSLGIADSVTVLAKDAATADAAATLIASAVDLPGHPAIRRVPAATLDDSSDLGEQLVTIAIEALLEVEQLAAIGTGADLARQLLGDARIVGALIVVGEQRRVVGDHRLLPRPALAIT